MMTPLKYRAISIDEHQLWRCVEKKIWAFSRNLTCEEGEIIYLFVENKLAAKGSLTKRVDTPTEEIFEIFSEDKYKYFYDVYFEKILEKDQRTLTGREVFYETHKLRNYGVYFRLQNYIPDDKKLIQKDLENYLNVKSNNNEVKEKFSAYEMQQLLKVSFKDRLQKALLHLEETFKTGKYTKKREYINVIDTFLFIELCIYNINIKKREINGNLMSVLNEYDELMKKQKEDLNKYREVLKNIRINFKNGNEIYKEFGRSVQNLGWEDSRKKEVSQVVRTVIKEIEYGIKNKFLNNDFLSVVRDSYDFLSVVRDSYDSLVDDVENFNDSENRIKQMMHQLVIEDQLSSLKHQRVSILDENYIRETLYVNNFKNLNLDVSLKNNRHVKYKSVNYLLNNTDIDKLHPDSEKEQDKYDVIFFSENPDSQNDFSQQILTKLSLLNDRGTLIAHTKLDNNLNEKVNGKNEFSNLVKDFALNIIEMNTECILIFKNVSGSQDINKINVMDGKNKDPDQLFNELKKLKVFAVKNYIEANFNFLLYSNSNDNSSNKINERKAVDELFTEEQREIIKVYIEKNLKEVAISNFYEIYSDSVSTNKSKNLQTLNIHDFTHTLSLMEKLGIFLKVEKYHDTLSHMPLLSLIKNNHWSLSNQIREEWKK